MDGLMETTCLVDVLQLLSTPNLLRLREINKGFDNYIKKNMKCFKIDCSDSEITDEQLKALAGCSTIFLRNCRNITDNGLKILTDQKEENARFSNLHTIDLHWCDQITDDGVKALIGVRSIELSGCTKVTDEGISLLLEVEKISLYECSLITDVGLQALVGVNSINLERCPNITDNGIKALIKPEIEDQKRFDYICLISNKNITDESLKLIGKVGVKRIYLQCCDNITDEGVIALAGVNVISLHCCDKITEKSLDILRKANPDVMINK